MQLYVDALCEVYDYLQQPFPELASVLEFNKVRVTDSPNNTALCGDCVLIPMHGETPAPWAKLLKVTLYYYVPHYITSAHHIIDANVWLFEDYSHS